MQELINFYSEKKQEIKSRLQEFSKLRGASDERLFYELCFCIMAVQTSGVRSWKTAESLRRNKFFERGQRPEKFLREGYIRFHNNKSKHLLEMRAKFPEILRALKGASSMASGIKSIEEMREWLVQNVKGVGWKEASHFLRNIGRTRELAILDRHILRNMVRFGFADGMPKSLTKNKYLELEQSFINMASSLEMKPAELDLLLWAKETGFVFK
ncbi:MAG TPA: N-glycosylase/DNA lyase [Nanoarchaeota archaeon]|nr:N-glycosylase/DNA lyase [Nanoarchaeota archaeon]